eukprot:555020-Amphidinium_carterae.3
MRFVKGSDGAHWRDRCEEVHAGDLQWKGFPLKEAEVQAPAPDQNLKDAYEMLPSGELLPKCALSIG